MSLSHILVWSTSQKGDRILEKNSFHLSDGSGCSCKKKMWRISKLSISWKKQTIGVKHTKMCKPGEHFWHRGAKKTLCCPSKWIWLDQVHSSAKQNVLELPPLPVTVTTRIVTFLIGNPYKPSFTTVTGWGVDLKNVKCWELRKKRAWYSNFKSVSGHISLTLMSVNST